MLKKIFLVFIAALFIFNQALASEVLKKDTKIGDNVYPQGTEVGYYGSKKIKWVLSARPLTINGLKCISNHTVVFYESGKLKSFRLTTQTTIDGIKCAANYLVELYESGKIRTASMAEPTKIQGIKVNCRDFVTFYEDGKLSGLMIQQPVEIKGKKYYPTREIYLDHDGNVTDTKELDSGCNYY